MALFLKQTHTFATSRAATHAAALAAIAALEGKVAKQDAAKGEIEAVFDKRVLGKVLGDRSRFKLVLAVNGETGCSVQIEAYPLNAVGQRLLFGERPGVIETVHKLLIERMQANPTAGQ